ncbi:DUF775-domain-containing protein [Stereum hirsutum FP-91666 SS1]|uniref:DUF775-domain-containing protein n=1 Tax=Stereum hirsutum (strain FP-91666) TaxID=721885 RepID=UPI000440AA86|nr:DUF775-domain-containing protein [Stereum hirsutum FP-91666 SS1]EIM87588.1 DUF775-domain-containing protein [Stereum hirsutum FP-91666 SS1]
MFGCCVAGRLLQTNLQQIDETHAAFELPSATSINHICVFLLGTVPFPEGYGATVHFYWPGKGFQLLGMLSNEKPSAIFRLRGTFSSQSTTTQAHAAFSSAPTEDTGVTAILGFSVEPLDQIAMHMSILPSSTAGSASAPNQPSSLVKPIDPTVIAEKIVKHLFNYVSGFISGSGSGIVGPDSVVPMGLIAKWYESFLGKIKAGGMGFLDRQE